MIAGIASLAKNIPKISKISKIFNREKKVPIFRVEPYPSKNENLKKGASVFTEDPKSLGKWFTTDKNFIKAYPTLTMGGGKIVKKTKVPESKLKEWDATKVHSYVNPAEKSVIVPDEIAKQAKFSVLESIPFITRNTKGVYNPKTGDYKFVDYSDWKEILERVRELIALKKAGKKRGGIVSL